MTTKANISTKRTHTKKGAGFKMLLNSLRSLSKPRTW